MILYYNIKKYKLFYSKNKFFKAFNCIKNIFNKMEGENFYNKFLF